VFNIFHIIGSSAGLSTLLAPYFIAFHYFTHDRFFSHSVLESMKQSSADDSQQIRCGHFVDFIQPEENRAGQRWLQNIENELLNKPYDHIITCRKESTADDDRLKIFNPVGSFVSPVDCEKEICFPPVLEMVNYCYDRQLARIHAASPGPVGLAALAAARMLKIPVDGTYDISYNDFIQRFAGDDDESINELISRFIIWFYDQMDTIFVLNEASKTELVANGITTNKINRIYPEIDLQLYHPSNRNALMAKHPKLRTKTYLLYDGPVTRDNNLDLLVEVYKILRHTHGNLHLLVVGAGPYRSEMKKMLSNAACTFTGELEPEQLSAVYAISNLFVAPGYRNGQRSNIARAQAAGLPIVVTKETESSQDVEDGRTGIVVNGNDASSLYEAIQALLKDSEIASRLGRAAREYIERKHWHQVLSEPIRFSAGRHKGGSAVSTDIQEMVIRRQVATVANLV
jgi:glycosyltransferase involved in cell wall biosynthesis